MTDDRIDRYDRNGKIDRNAEMAKLTVVTEIIKVKKDNNYKK